MIAWSILPCRAFVIFRGVTAKLDGRGNLTVGLREQLVFPEIDFDKIDKVRGMEVTIVTTAKTDEEGRRLLVAARYALPGKLEGVYGEEMHAISGTAAQIRGARAPSL